MTGQPTVVVALHDGFYGSGTGAGYANRGFLQVLTGLLAPPVRLVVLPVRLASNSPEYQADWHAASLELCERAAATVLPVDNGTEGQIRFGGVPAFQRLAVSVGTTLHAQVLPTAGPLAVILFDVPFLGLAPLLPPAAGPSLTAVIRSTGILHDPGNTARIAFERSGLGYLTARSGRVAAISAYMREHLARDYAVPPAALVSLPDGLVPSEWDERQPMLPLPPAACDGFLLAFGRAQAYKGWDDLLDALAALSGRGPTRAPLPHAVLAAVTDQPGLSEYQRHLGDRIRALGLDATLLTRFDPGIRALLGHPALRVVVAPSRSEPFGRIPMEAYAAGASPVVTTTAGGLAEQVIDGVTGFTAAPADPASLSAAIERALSLDAGQRERMRAAGRELARTRFDHSLGIQRFFADFAPWACH
ncbi:MAG TPA: glycosyltransferase family 4 protein [Streptosporangiaceae bacterium]|nr:glycosyltransferase family 4 protein [Streptosporangiaceae bacterium]